MPNLSNKPKQRQARFKDNKRIRKSGLIFDKIAFILPLAGYDDALTTINALKCLKSNKDGQVKVRWEVDGFIMLSLCFRPEGRRVKRAIVHVVVSATKNFLKFEFNPSTTDKAVYEYLDMVVQNVTHHGSFQEYCLYAHISRLDVCYDLLGLDIRDHVLAVKRFRTGRSWTDGDRPVAEGVYPHESIVFGARGGNSVGIYDKVKQDPTVYPHESAVMRVEDRRRPQARTFYAADLLSLENKFPRIMIFNALLAQPSSAPPGFVDLWRRMGFRKACLRRKIPQALREKILKECAPAEFLFWRVMQKTWKQDVLDGLKACGLYEIAMASLDRRGSLMPLTGAFK